MSLDITGIAPKDLLKMVKKAGGQRKFSKEHGVPRTTLQHILYKLRKEPFSHRPAPKAKRVGEKRGIRRFILSSAQDSTMLHEEFITNLEAYRDWLQKSGTCEIMIGGFTYGKGLFEEHSAKSVAWPDRIKPYIVADRIRIADKIDFCAEMNTMPTATTPLSGLNSYTQDRWGIFPHAKVQLLSVPTMKHLPSKQIMTTGTVTKSNYVMKKAGIKASFHHVFGAVLVEIDTDGVFFCRHLIADDKGNFQDLGRLVKDGKVSVGYHVDVMTPGDVHVDQMDEIVAEVLFGLSGKKEAVVNSMTGQLRPNHMFLHDVLDFMRRNHHNLMDPHFRYKMHIQNTDSVEDEVIAVALFLDQLSDNFPKTKIGVVDSNHDQALKKWLANADYRYDPVNAIFFLKCQLAVYEAMRNGVENFAILEHVIKREFRKAERVVFLREDKTPIQIGGVEHSAHGHRGPNGSRGGVASLTKVATKITIGHVHSPAILDGLYAAGTTSKLDMSYNAGPGSWAHTVVVQYPNGKRALVTLQDGRWCVPC